MDNVTPYNGACGKTVIGGITMEINGTTKQPPLLKGVIILIIHGRYIRQCTTRYVQYVTIGHNAVWN